MGRPRSTWVGVVVAAMLAAVIAGVVLSWLVFRSPPGARANMPSAPMASRSGDATVYTAPSGILFDVDSAALRPEAPRALRAIAEDLLRSHPNGTIKVEGHTDDVGSEEYNRLLAQARAETVADWLVGEAGVPRARIQVIAYGEGAPAYPNDSEAHRQANRRVVIAVAAR